MLRLACARLSPKRGGCQTLPPPAPLPPSTTRLRPEKKLQHTVHPPKLPCCGTPLSCASTVAWCYARCPLCPPTLGLAPGASALPAFATAVAEVSALKPLSSKGSQPCPAQPAPPPVAFAAVAILPLTGFVPRTPPLLPNFVRCSCCCCGPGCCCCCRCAWSFQLPLVYTAGPPRRPQPSRVRPCCCCGGPDCCCCCGYAASFPMHAVYDRGVADILLGSSHEEIYTSNKPGLEKT